MGTIIEVEGLSKRFGDTVALDDVSLEVQRGTVLGFSPSRTSGIARSITT